LLSGKYKILFNLYIQHALEVMTRVKKRQRPAALLLWGLL